MHFANPDIASRNSAGGNVKATKSGNKGQNIAQSATGLADSIVGGNGGNIAKSALDLAGSIVGRATEGAEKEEEGK